MNLKRFEHSFSNNNNNEGTINSANSINNSNKLDSDIIRKLMSLVNVDNKNDIASLVSDLMIEN